MDQVHGTKSLLTRTVVDKDESDETLAEAHAKAARYQAEVVTLQSQLRDATAKHTAATARLSAQVTDASAKIALLTTKLSTQATESSAEIAPCETSSLSKIDASVAIPISKSTFARMK